jgi:hypothetical protein
MFTEHMHALYVHFQIINIFLCTKFRNTGRKASRLARSSDRFRSECKYISLLQTMYLYVVFILQYQKVQNISHFVLKDKKKPKTVVLIVANDFLFTTTFILLPLFLPLPGTSKTYVLVSDRIK